MDVNEFQEELFLTNQTGSRLYHKYAEDLPILDYHCHLLPQEIYENKEFEDLGEMWLAHDHYKWRAMRTFGIEEEFITGSAAYYEKFIKFAGLLPKLAGNPIYIWCALELKRYFGISEPLTSENAKEIYSRTKKLIKEHRMTPRWCMETSRVEFVCTTEDPVDNLTYHKLMREDNSLKVKIVSAFRPDKAFYCEKSSFLEYIQQLARVSAVSIGSFKELLQALEVRLLHFKELGSTISDHGIESFIWQDYSPLEIEQIFAKSLKAEVLTHKEINQYKSAFLAELGSLYEKHGFVMQLHIGTYQGANRTGERTIGVACGFDCTDDSTSIQAVGGLLNYLTGKRQLPKTLLYPLNPAQIETFAILAAGFCEGGTKAKVQLGAPWWFNDQAYGINRQFEAIANLYPLSLSVGMLTDSRSFLSYPRHELYRRVLCDYIGRLVERGEYFSDEKYLQEIIEDVCYNNAKEYFRI
jgi:glucuronate isomerase